MRFSRWMLIGLLMSGVLLLAACGGDDGGDDDTNNSDTTSSESAASDGNFTGTISGAVEKDFAFNARFSCQDSGMENVADIFEMVATPGTEQVYVNLPFDTATGTFELLGSDDFVGGGTPSEELYQIRYRTEDRTTYNTGSGEMVITNVPTAPGELFSGTLTVELSSDDEEEGSITFEGTFDVPAASFAFDGCE